MVHHNDLRDLCEVANTPAEWKQKVRALMEVEISEANLSCQKSVVGNAFRQPDGTRRRCWGGCRLRLTKQEVGRIGNYPKQPIGFSIRKKGRMQYAPTIHFSTQEQL